MLQIFILFLGLNLNSKIPYYYDPRIHNFGNIGIKGKMHAEICYFSTKLIDKLRYNNINIRSEIMSEYEDESVLDFCCGIGISTTKNGIGIDTSSEMLNVAKRTYPNKVFYNSNAETFKPDKKIDVVSCMFAFHEMPQEAHIKIINNAIQIAKKEVVIVDIASNYVPKQIMLSGEPYLLDYLNNIDETLKSFNKTVYIDKHVNIWKYFP